MNERLLSHGYYYYYYYYYDTMINDQEKKDHCDTLLLSKAIRLMKYILSSPTNAIVSSSFPLSQVPARQIRSWKILTMCWLICNIPVYSIHLGTDWHNCDSSAICVVYFLIGKNREIKIAIYLKEAKSITKNCNFPLPLKLPEEGRFFCTHHFRACTPVHHVPQLSEDGLI